MDKVAVGLDGSAAAQTALRWAVDLCQAIGANVVGLTAVPTPTSEAGAPEHDRLFAERKELIDQAWLGPVRASGVAVEAMVRGGDPRRVVLDAALGAGADLLVLGRTGYSSGPGFLHLGSVVEHAAHRATLPLAVIPASSPDEIDRIAVGVDGSPGSLAALEWAGEVAKALDTEVLAVQVLEPFLEWTPTSSPENWRRGVERTLEGETQRWSDAGVSVVPIAQRNLSPADGLLGVAAARRADLIVVGTRGSGGFKGLRAGGVALKVLHRAQLPLVMIPER